MIYPVPLDSPEVWAEFKPYVQRFCDSCREFPIPEEETILAMTCNGYANDEVRDMFFQLPATFKRYDGAGCDIGSAQFVSRFLKPNDLMICMTSRCYLHRSLWLERFAVARGLYGPGLYGCSASHEGGRLHLCTRAYALDAADFREYPLQILNREMGPMFEVGRDNPHGNLMEWMEARGRAPRLVFWDGVREKSDWFTVPNRFRNGDQSAMLVHDRHTDAYRDAAPEQKAILERWANTGIQ